MRNVRVTFAAAFMAATAASTFAAAGEDQMRVSLAGYDVASPQGAKVVFRKITSAAEAFCGDASSRELARMSAQRACVARMVAKAVDQLNAPQVTALQGRRQSLPATRVALGVQ